MTKKKKPSIFSNEKKRRKYLIEHDISSHVYKKKKYTRSQMASLSEYEFRKILKSYQQKQRRELKKVTSTDAIVYIAKKYLGVWWSTTDDDFSMVDFIAMTKKMSNESIIQSILHVLKNALNSPNGSNNLHGFYFLQYADDIEELKAYEKEAKSRGYTKSLMAVNNKFVEKFVSLQDARVNTFAMSNKFTKRGFLILHHCIICNVLNELCRSYHNDMKTFLRLFSSDLFEELKKDGLF